jgi:hypothetical protein
MAELVLCKKYLSAFNLFELWLILIFITIILISKYTSWLVLPLALCFSSTALFATILVCALTFIAFTPNGHKCNVLFPLIKLGLQMNCPTAVENFSNQNFENAIIIANYPASFIEYLLIPIICQESNIKTTIVTSNNAGIWAKLFIDSDYVLPLAKKENNFSKLEEKIVKLCQTKRVPIVYPERNFWYRPNADVIQEFRSGIFQIAKNNNLKVILAHVEHINHTLGFMNNTQLCVKFEECKEIDAVAAREQMNEMMSIH